MGNKEHFLVKIHYNYGPPFLIIGCLVLVQIFAVCSTTNEDVSWSIFGNTYSWAIVSSMMLWALISLLIPGKEYRGPASLNGFTPVYRANGFQYFLTSLMSFIILLLLRPKTALELTHFFPQILASCNIVALVLCLVLLVKGLMKETEHENLPLVYKFYRGMEIHPVLFGIDVKQLTNCRFGLMAWLLLIIAFGVSSWLRHGFSVASFVCVLLQTIYLAKFYWCETGYFHTLDITLDRGGFYICWGCLVWVPAFYTFVAYYLSSRPPLISINFAWLIFTFGLITTFLNYWVDAQKEYFQKSEGKCYIWHQPAKFIEATYRTVDNKTRHSKLLIAGFWGISRHLNYVFEIFLAFSWSLPALGYGIWPFSYPIFLTMLLIHRIFRDEKKCAEKYGAAWREYCQKVPYRMIPKVF